MSINPDEQAFIGETITLRCDIQGGGNTEWRYAWKKNEHIIYINRAHCITQECRISFVRKAHSGKYTCSGIDTGSSHHSKISAGVSLTVSGEYDHLYRVHSPQYNTTGI